MTSKMGNGDWVGQLLSNGTVMVGRHDAGRGGHLLEAWPGYVRDDARLTLFNYAQRDGVRAWWIEDGQTLPIEY